MTVIVFQLKKIQIPFQGDDTKGLEEGNWISLQSWVPWVTVIPLQTSGTDLHKIYIYTSVERFYHEKIAILKLLEGQFETKSS